MAKPSERFDMPDRICSIEGCVRPHLARGWCGTHYRRWEKHGDPTHSRPSSILERLAARSKTDGDCLIWIGSTQPKGYGRLWIDGRYEAVHRVAWIAKHGEIPAETPNVLHRCDNPPCWADAHLFLGTTQDNMTDMALKGRGWWQKPDAVGPTARHRALVKI